MKARPEYVWEKFFDVPRETVWRLWTNPQLFAAWYGPNVETLVHRMQVAPGGLALIEMKWEDGKSQFQKFEYTKVDPGEKLAWLQSIADSAWNSVAVENWPEYLLTTVEIHREGGRDCMHFTWSPYGDVTDKEIDNFKRARLDIDEAWKSALVLFDEVLQSVALM